MLADILEVCVVDTPQDNPQVTPQVKIMGIYLL